MRTQSRQRSRLRWRVVATAFAAVLLVPGLAWAQSDGADQVDDAGSLDVVPPDAPVTVQADTPRTAPVPAGPAIDMSTRVSSYLNAVRDLPLTLFQEQDNLDTRLQDYRLGAVPRDRLARLLPRAAISAANIDSRWQRIIPPPHLVEVHTYATAASSETHLGVQITVDHFMAGGSTIPPAAAEHFDRSNQLMAMAFEAIDAIAGP